MGTLSSPAGVTHGVQLFTEKYTQSAATVLQCDSWTDSHFFSLQYDDNTAAKPPPSEVSVALLSIQNMECLIKRMKMDEIQ